MKLVLFLSCVCLSCLVCFLVSLSLSSASTTRLHDYTTTDMDGWMDAVLYSYLSMTYTVYTVFILSQYYLFRS